MLEPLLRIVFNGELDNLELDSRWRVIFAFELLSSFKPAGRLVRCPRRSSLLFDGARPRRGICHSDVVAVSSDRKLIPLCLRHITGVRLTDTVTIGVFVA